MKKFQRGTILKLTCDIHEFLAKAPKVYEDLIDIIDEDGQVKVKTHNGDYVGLYGMKAKIHTRFMKKFEVAGETFGEDEIVDTVEEDKPEVIKMSDGVQMVGMSKFEVGMINAMKDIALLCGYQFAVDVGYEDIAEKVSTAISIKQSLLEETTDSLAKAASKLNSLGCEFDNGEWLTQAEIKERKVIAMADKIQDMTAWQVAQLLIDNNIEL